MFYCISHPFPHDWLLSLCPSAQGVRFEEFDFSYYNRTPFTGLENDLANCYTNALLQARAGCNERMGCEACRLGGLPALCYVHIRWAAN